MMEETLRRLPRKSGAFLLFWNMLAVSFLLRLAVVEGHPFLINATAVLEENNNNSKPVGNKIQIEDDLAISSEEDLDDLGVSFRDYGTFNPFNFSSSSPASAPSSSTHDKVEQPTRRGLGLNAPSALSKERSIPESSNEPTTLESTEEGMDVNLVGFSIDYDSDKRRVEYDPDGTAVILEGLHVKLTLFGTFKPGTMFRFSKSHWCKDPINDDFESYMIDVVNDTDGSVATVHVTIPDAGELNLIYICLRSPTAKFYRRQGENKTGELGLPIKPWLIIRLTKSMFPLSLHCLFIVLLLMLSGLFSGLNLGLMSLDKTDLKIIMNTGSKSEKNYAQSIAPVRNHGNFLLCCLLFSNVLVNATLTILVDDLTSGLIAIAGSTLAIVIFGEIIPQAICSRYGLAVGAKTIYITKLFMLLTFPLAFPLSILLDKVLGEEIGNIYTRERLKELLRVTQDHHGLETEEVGIISGALDLKLKTVKDVMVPLSKIFMLPADTILDFDTMAEIEFQGYSRIPVYDGDRSNVVALINLRQLTLLDASDNIPIRRIMDFYKQQLFFVFENTHLDFMFKAFREGSRGHMAFVQFVNDKGPGDPYYETVGMLTMEDVLEEILQADIKDENDIEKDQQRTGQVQPQRAAIVPFRNTKKPKKVVEIPSTLAHAATQFLSTYVDPFKNDTISIPIIQRLLKTNVQFMKAPKRRGRAKPQDVFLYEAGKSADSFVMILEGRVQVTVGKERLTYEAGPFSTFGTDFLLNDHLGMPLIRSNPTVESSLNSPTDIDPSERPSITSEMADIKRRTTFIPDYSVKLLTDIYYLQLRHEHYSHALTATELQRVHSIDPEKSVNGDEWQDEIDKVLETVDGDDDKEETDDRTVVKCLASPPPYPAGTADDLKLQSLNPNIIVNGIAVNGKEHNASTSTETDSDNKDSDEHDESNHPTEATKLLPNNIPCS